DLQANTTTFVSRATGVGGDAGDGNSLNPSISADGRFVAFESDADDLSTEDNNAVTNVFVRDVLGTQPPPSLSINNVSAKEGRKGTKPFTFTVSLSGVNGRFVTVEFTTEDGTAKAPGDYLSTNGTLTFAP